MGWRSTAGARPDASTTSPDVNSDIVTVRISPMRPSRSHRGDAPVVRPKAPVLVHHEAHAATDIRDERRGVGERRRERLLTDDREAAIRGQPADWRVGLARRRHVDRVELLLFEHRLY